ncbi:MAG: 3-methyl-2-oxobutanoate dehydrogenase subunit VorB [Anaerolineaceae bacterium]|nr:3-methyl-2-oxobutanoate dehydrogenase subunit VorB [Anaerolineaceae bacterium]
MTKELLKGNHAFAEAAIRAGLEAYFGYPITPQTEALEWMSHRMPELGRVFLQAESELAAINMVYGAACTGARVMTSSSSPGISLMQEGISYIAGSEVPTVLVDVMRGGPGLGNIAPGQADYNQMVKNGGNGDYFPIILAPSSVQETIDLTVESFDLAEKYRSIVVVLIDGNIGQMMEPAELPPMQPLRTKYPDWAVRGTGKREKNVLNSLYINPPEEEKVNIRLMKRWQEIKKNEIRFKEYYMEDAEFAVIGFGSSGRIALSAVREARKEGIKVGLLRPIVLSPFPEAAIREVSKQLQGILVVEMNMGQMLEDIRKATQDHIPINFYGRMGGIVPMPDAILNEIRDMAKGELTLESHPVDRWFKKHMEHLYD